MECNFSPANMTSKALARTARLTLLRCTVFNNSSPKANVLAKVNPTRADVSVLEELIRSEMFGPERSCNPHREMTVWTFFLQTMSGGMGEGIKREKRRTRGRFHVEHFVRR